jgi:hypothetical protein
MDIENSIKQEDPATEKVDFMELMDEFISDMKQCKSDLIFAPPGKPSLKMMKTLHEILYTVYLEYSAAAIQMERQTRRIDDACCLLRNIMDLFADDNTGTDGKAGGKE